MSVRGDVDWVFPRHGAFGKSLRLCGGGGDAPLWLRNVFARLMFRMKYGKLDRYGMRPTCAPLNRRIGVSDEFYPLIAHGAVCVNRGGVRSVDKDVVTFADGSKKRFDAVVLCTGYDVATSVEAHPYLKEQFEDVRRGDVSDAGKPFRTKTRRENGNPLEFYLGCFHPEIEKCAFVGGCFGFAAVPRVAELQARAAVNVITGVRPLPPPKTQKTHIREILKFHVQKGNTNVYTANAYYRELMEAAGELRSAKSVNLGVRAKGAALSFGALSVLSEVLGKATRLKGLEVHVQRRLVKHLKRVKNIDSDSFDSAPKALAATSLALFAVGEVFTRFGRSKGSAPAAVSQMPPETCDHTDRDIAIAKQHVTHMHTSDSVLSMGSLGCESSASSSASAPHSPRSPAPVKMAEGATAVAQKIAASRFKTPKEEVKDAYDTWADAYEHDSLEKLGFASPKACVDAFIKFCPPRGKDVLDIGAGTGVLAHMICQRGIKARNFDAMDLSPGMLKHLMKKGIYNKVKAHDMSKYPWPFQSNSYDGSMCNGVLIYVDDSNCLDEFVRVVKPGGICVIMFRHDGYPGYAAKVEQLREQGKWELVHKTPDQRNFVNMEFGENNEEDVIFNQHVFRVLEKSAEIEL
jgi:ubiquinone/menaquinone biosynthesis C-methylase UbiE